MHVLRIDLVKGCVSDQLLFFYTTVDRFFRRTLYLIDFRNRFSHLIIFSLKETNSELSFRYSLRAPHEKKVRSAIFRMVIVKRVQIKR